MSFFDGTFASPKDIAASLQQYFDDPEIGTNANIASYDLIVPMALTPPAPQYNTRYKRFFPVKIDCGFNGTLHISLKHFYEWARWTERPRHNGRVDYAYINSEKETFDAFKGVLWLPDTQLKECAKIPLSHGFTMCDVLTDEGNPIPRIPVIGQRALRTAGVTLTIDYFKRAFGIDVAK